MKVYFIENKTDASYVVDKLKSQADLVLLEKNTKDIYKYTELFTDKSDKVLAIAPGRIEWKLPNQALDEISSIKAICTKSSWAHYIDLKYCKSKGIIVTNTPGANSQSVAEYAIWQMLSLARKLPLQIHEGFTNKWNEEHQQMEIQGKTMGVIGLGQIGSRLARMGDGLGMKVIYWSRSGKAVPYSKLSLEEVVSRSDFVFNCLETSSETKGMLNKNVLSRLKPAACFVSVLGGAGFGVEDDEFLINMVKAGKLSGFSIESEHEHGYTVPDVLGHNIFIPGAYAWFTKEAKERTNKTWLEAIIGAVNGHTIHQVN